MRKRRDVREKEKSLKERRREWEIERETGESMLERN
jgi:hypothetical protein